MVRASRTKGAAVRGWMLRRITPNSSLHRSLWRVRKWLPRGAVGRYIAGWLNFRLARRWSCHIDPRATIGQVLFMHPSAVVIGAGVVVEDGVTIFQGVTLGGTRGGFPVVRRGATIYGGASVLGPVEVGHHAVVGAGAVVLTDVPPYATAVGVPAHIVPKSEQREDDETSTDRCR